MSFTNRLIQGDGSAYNRLFEEYHQQVYAFCLKIISSEELAEEVMMDVFLTVWKKRKRIDPERSVKSLLYKVARDLSIDCLRKIVRERKHQVAFSDCKEPTARNTAEDYLVTEEYNQLAHHAIDQLPTQRRVIFTMRRQLDMSPSEIAQQLGISKNTVRVQLVRANKFLRDYLTTRTDISFFWAVLIFFFD